MNNPTIAAIMAKHPAPTLWAYDGIETWQVEMDPNLTMHEAVELLAERYEAGSGGDNPTTRGPVDLSLELQNVLGFTVASAHTLIRDDRRPR